MDMSGEYRVPAGRERVWQALNDPEMLKKALPGCEKLEKVGDNELAATVVAKVGPVKAKFNGHVTLSNLKPPESYTISGEGKGGAAGFAKGGADVHLTPEGDAATVLAYKVKAEVGGKLAQIGSRLIDATAKKMADDFFECFCKELEAPAPAPTPAPAPPPELPSAAGTELLQNKFVWVAAAIIVLMIIVMLFR